MATGCTDDASLVSSEPELGDLSEEIQRSNILTEPVCEVITFDQFGHGDAVTSVSLPTLGLTLSLTTNRWVSQIGQHGGLVTARAFETDGLNDDPDGTGSVVVEDDDLQWRGEDAPGESDGGGECAGCEGLGRLLVIPDQRSFVPWGDHIWGGRFTFSGDFSGGDYYIESFKAVDVDGNEPGIRLLVDGTQRAQSANLGNGTVQTVNVAGVHTISSNFSFVLGTEAQDNKRGSGAIDGIRVCQQQEPSEGGGDEGCTLGYWKNHSDSWAATGYSPNQRLESVFDVPNSFGLDNNTLLQALRFNGGRGALGGARLLLKQAVAALLNASHPDVDYELTTAQVIAQVNAALASGSRSTMLALKDTLDRYNNAGCPLN